MKRKKRERKEKAVYSAIVYQRTKTKKGYRFKRVNGKPFRRNVETRFYIQHNKTKATHLVAQGKFYHVPYKKGELDQYVFSKYGRDTKIPKKVKAVGNWKPIETVHKDFVTEAQKLKREKRAKRSAVFFPMKNYFNTKWKVFADRPMRGTERVSAFYAMALIYFAYQSRNFVSKHSIYVEMNSTMIKNVYSKYHDRVENLVATQLAGKHPDADAVEVVSINGIVPL